MIETENIVLTICHLFNTEIKEILSIVLRDLRFSSAVVHQVRYYPLFYLLILVKLLVLQGLNYYTELGAQI